MYQSVTINFFCFLSCFCFAIKARGLLVTCVRICRKQTDKCLIINKKTTEVMNKQSILFLLLLVFGGTVFAQRTDDVSVRQDTLPEVSVSAKTIRKSAVLKIDVPPAYLPISTNEVSHKTLEMRGVQDLQQVSQFLPGIRIRTSYGAFQQINIRGFENSVVMVDGVRDERSAIDNSYPFPDLSAVQSVELIKGPGSILFGQSTVGGVLNITRREPVAQKSVNARLSLGSFNYRRAQMSMGGVLAGPVTYFANVNFSDEKGWRNTGNKRFSGYLALRSAIGKRGILDLRSGFNRDYYGTEIGLPRTMPADIFTTDGDKLHLKWGELQSGLNREARFNNQSDFFHNNGENISLQYRHIFGDALKISNRLSFVNDDINYFSTEELSYPTSDDPVYKHYYMVGNNKRYINLDSVQLTFPLRFSHMAKTVGNQFELSGKFATGAITHNYLGGYAFQTLIRNSFQGYDLGVDVQGPGYLSKVDVRNPQSMGYMTERFSRVAVMRTNLQGVYVSDLMEFGEKWKVLLAARYDHYAYRRANTDVIDGERRFDMPKAESFNKVRSSGFTYRAGAVYLPVPSLSLYASAGSYQKPYRTFYNENTIYIGADGKEFFPESGKTIFKPETGLQYEVGARYDVGNKWSFNTSLFYINKQNTVRTLRRRGEEVIRPDETTYTLDKNVSGQVGRMNSKGFDVDITTNVVKNLALTLGYGYTDARVRELMPNDFLKTDDLKGKPNTYVPGHTFYAYGNYGFTRGFLKNLNVNMHLTYQDKVYVNVTQNVVFPAYWLANLGAAYAVSRNTTVSLVINNVFNTQYYNQALDGKQLVPSAPRSYLFSVAYSY